MEVDGRREVCVVHVVLRHRTDFTERGGVGILFNKKF